MTDSGKPTELVVDFNADDFEQLQRDAQETGYDGRLVDYVRDCTIREERQLAAERALPAELRVIDAETTERIRELSTFALRLRDLAHAINVLARYDKVLQVKALSCERAAELAFRESNELAMELARVRRLQAPIGEE